MLLSIIILNYNARDLLKQTIASISETISHEIIVVDNASTDDSAAMVAKEFPEAVLVRNQKNNGFAYGNNVGINVARGKYLLMLNSDTIVQPGALKVLVNYLKKHPKVGIVGPKLILSDGSLDMAGHRGFPTPLNSLFYFSRLSKIFPNSKLLAGYHQTWENFNAIHEVDAISGAALMFPRELVNDIGKLDEQFFMYAEDIDFCYRAKQAGWKVVYNPEATIVHLKGQSGTQSSNQKTRSKTRKYFYQTMKQYYQKHYGHRYPKPVMWLINAGVDVLEMVKR